MSQNKIYAYILFTTLLISGCANSLNAPHDTYAPAKTVSPATQTVTVQEPVQIPENTPSEFEIRTEKRKKLSVASNVSHGSFLLFYLSMVALDPLALSLTAAGTGLFYLIGKTVPHVSNAVSRQEDIETYFVTIFSSETDANNITRTASVDLESSCHQEVNRRAQEVVVKIFEKNPNARIWITSQIKAFGTTKRISLPPFSVTHWGKNHSRMRKFTTLQKYVFKRVGLTLENLFVVCPTSNFLNALTWSAIVGVYYIIFALPYYSVSFPPLLIPFACINILCLPVILYYAKDLS